MLHRKGRSNCLHKKGRSSTINKKAGLALDIYKNNLVLDFSYYRLLSSYKGACVRVRRSSDNAEQDFGFVSDYIDVYGILAFCDGGSGYVKTWYNQYGLGNNAIQNTNANQPRIVNAGVFDSEGLFFSGSHGLRVNNYSGIDFTTNLFSILVKAKMTNDATIGFPIAKNVDSSANTQYALLSNAKSLTLRIEGAVDRIATTWQVSDGLSLVQARTNTNLHLSINNGASNVASYSGALTSRPYLIVGARDNVGASLGGGFAGYIRTLVILNDYIRGNSLIDKL